MVLIWRAVMKRKKLLMLMAEMVFAGSITETGIYNFIFILLRFVFVQH